MLGKGGCRVCGTTNSENRWCLWTNHRNNLTVFAPSWVLLDLIMYDSNLSLFYIKLAMTPTGTHSSIKTKNPNVDIILLLSKIEHEVSFPYTNSFLSKYENIKISFLNFYILTHISNMDFMLATQGLYFHALISNVFFLRHRLLTPIVDLSNHKVKIKVLPVGCHLHIVRIQRGEMENYYKTEKGK